jgi:hypothetical protein
VISPLDNADRRAATFRPTISLRKASVYSKLGDAKCFPSIAL